MKNLTSLLTTANTKIAMLVMDGLGGLPMAPDEKTELETAHTPNMDRLAAEGILGQTLPIDYGVTPGSGPVHLSLFGYDPVAHEVGRGVLEALVQVCLFIPVMLPYVVTSAWLTRRVSSPIAARGALQARMLPLW